MAETLQFVVQYGYVLLFFWVLAEQLDCRFRRRRCCWRQERWPDNTS